MDLRRSFTREKLIKAFTEVIAKNYDGHESAFAADWRSSRRTSPATPSTAT